MEEHHQNAQHTVEGGDLTVQIINGTQTEINEKSESNQDNLACDQTDGLIEDVISVGLAVNDVYDEVVEVRKDSTSPRFKIKRVGAAVIGLLLAVVTLGASVGIISDVSLQHIKKASPMLFSVTSTQSLVTNLLPVETLLCLTSQSMSRNIFEGVSDENTTQEDGINLDLVSPFTMMVIGPTGSGKTQFTSRLMSDANNLCSHPPIEIIYCYGIWQPYYDSFKLFDIPVKFHKGLISSDDLPTDGRPRWIVIDDLMRMGNKDDTQLLTDLFTRESHHRNMSIIYLTQNHFEKGTRTISINSHYLVLFKNPRDASTVASLAQQIFPGNGGFLKESYKMATQSPYSYLMLNMRQETDEQLRVLGRYREGDDESTDVYVAV